MNCSLEAGSSELASWKVFHVYSWSARLASVIRNSISNRERKLLIYITITNIYNYIYISFVGMQRTGENRNNDEEPEEGSIGGKKRKHV